MCHNPMRWWHISHNNRLQRIMTHHLGTIFWCALMVCRQFLPTEIQFQQCTGNLVVVQATLFKCGGMGLGIGISHRLANASTTSMFIHSWAYAALGSGEAVPSEFGAASRLPPRREFTPTPPWHLFYIHGIVIMHEGIRFLWQDTISHLTWGFPWLLIQNWLI
jgi:hypothetical protein